MILIFGLVVFGYFCGAIPFGVIVANLKGVDIREHGSGNIGATNVTRVLGGKLGAIVLVLDAAKGALPVGFAIQQNGDPTVVCMVGAATILGHCFSPWLSAAAFDCALLSSPTVRRRCWIRSRSAATL